MSDTLKIKMLTAISSETGSHAAGDVVGIDEKTAVRLVRSEQALPIDFDVADYADLYHDSVVDESKDASVVKDDDAPTDDDPVFEADNTADEDDSDVEVVDIESNETSDENNSNNVETREG